MKKQNPTRPLQSNSPELIPPHMYGEPRNRLATAVRSAAKSLCGAFMSSLKSHTPFASTQPSRPSARTTLSHPSGQEPDPFMTMSPMLKSHNTAAPAEGAARTREWSAVQMYLGALR